MSDTFHRPEKDKNETCTSYGNLLHAKISWPTASPCDRLKHSVENAFSSSKSKQQISLTHIAITKSNDILYTRHYF